LLQTMHSTLRQANASRLAARRRPIHLRWMHHELTGPRGKARQEAEDLWIGGDSLLVVDSISTYHPDVRRDLLELPDSQQPARAAVLWIPPYTRHTAALERSLDDTASKVNRLGVLFRNWERQPERAIAFDTPTPFALR